VPVISSPVNVVTAAPAWRRSEEVFPDFLAGEA